MTTNFPEIAELAEFIAEENFTRGTVNLEKIARKNEIEIHYDNFESYFTGMLQHENNLFDIFVNIDNIKKKRYPRTRFTIAHELGHYFIDEHRNLLKKGYSLSYDKELTYFSNLPVEKEANYFATNLLMPPNRFLKDMNAQNLGIESVKKLATQYKTSITSTLIQYSILLKKPSFSIIWDNSQNQKRKNFTESFYELFKQFSRDFLIRENLKQSIFADFNNPFYNPAQDISSVNGSLSSFFSSIKTEGPFDHPVKIETMSLQTYGFVSLVFPLE